MKATNWEFQNRALIFGLVFAISFPLYAFDPQNSTAVVGSWLGEKLRIEGDLVIRVLFALAAVVMIAAAFIRTWASAYLHAGVVYASEVKTAFLVADGPYRRVRNPLYFANILMAIAMGAMMSRSGFIVAVLVMTVFCCRLILREEAELQATQGERYQQYRELVPRLWPSLRARVASSGAQPRWKDGFMAEGWYWGFALSLVVFAITLKIKLFFWILGASVALFWVSSIVLQKKSDSQEA
ncbi:MAG TPA: isoprenylcysteine carboxylmethyltransferase family protein [Candidatus Angelobacter sp.]|nr:isoprenylcysteine carboxylmethyltransferase family protein [Candidatus Angelobacter sp.]